MTAPKNCETEASSARSKLPTSLVEISNKFPYITTDINVVAYLTMKKYEVDSVAREEGSNRANFCFMLCSAEEKNELKKHVRDYHNNVGNFLHYSDCWRNAKGFVHNLK
jgi:hypothetical protein